MKIAFIGGGNMGEAMLSATLGKGISSAQIISVCDINEARRHYIEQKYRVAVTSDSRLAVDSSDVVVLAVKPQNLAGVMVELNSHLKAPQLVLSIVAGARIDTTAKSKFWHHTMRRSRSIM